MADRKISELGSVVTPTVDDVYVLVQGGSTKKVASSKMFGEIPGDLGFDGVFKEKGAAQTMTGSGALSVTNAVSKVENASGVASAVTLPVATNGVVKKIVATVTNSNIVVTPSLGSGFSTITFTAVGQTVTLQYITDRWFILSAYGVTIA